VIEAEIVEDLKAVPEQLAEIQADLSKGRPMNGPSLQFILCLTKGFRRHFTHR
jgi:hypothetical protein